MLKQSASKATTFRFRGEKEMDKIHKEGSYSDAFDTLMQVIDKNDIAFGNGQLWAIQMVKQAWMEE